jgi:hypothetical protein
MPTQQPSVGFQAHDATHWLRVYSDAPRPDGFQGQLRADAEAFGEIDERFTVHYVSSDEVALQTAHGKFLSAQLDGRIEANRTSIQSWERWRLHRTNDGGVGFRSAHGKFMVAEQGGGGEVYANRGYSSPGLWETFRPTQPLGGGPTPVPVGPLSRLRVESNRRYFANDTARFEWREITAFSLLSRLLRGETDYVRRWLQARRTEGFTITRVILTLDGSYWAGGQNPLGQNFRCAPDMPGYWQQLHQLALMHVEAGLYMRACFVGAVEPFGGIWYPDRRDVWDGNVRSRGEAFVVEAAQRLEAFANVVGELANEPTEIGLRQGWDNGALVSLGRKVKAVAPRMLLCGGENNEGRGVTAPFDFADAHVDRSQGVAGWQWVKRQGEHPTADQTVMPFVSGEPINFGEPRVDGGRDRESQPAVAFGTAAVGRSRKWGGQCFHWDGGLWTTEPKPETLACIRAWHRGMDAFPMRLENVWRGHWGLAAGDYWRDNWPNDDNPDSVERFVREGRGAWRAFGCGPDSVVFPQPKNWDYVRNAEVAVERRGFCDEGTFDVAVYRRR